ncbi:MAG: MOSC domain-containing protein [Alphaproteobacteria bacterium]|nr:MOSC domain-containing protein [Alphaproteobacteria bacterium]
MHQIARVAQIYHYPIKGLSAQTLAMAPALAALKQGQALPDDRLWGFAQYNESDHNDAQKAGAGFRLIAYDPRLIALESVLHSTGQVTMSQQGKILVTADLTRQASSRPLTEFIADFLGITPRHAVVMAYAGFHQFNDSPNPTLSMRGNYRPHSVSLINLASLDALSDKIGFELHPLRFRGNLYVTGAPAFAERDWLDHRLALSRDNGELFLLEASEPCPSEMIELDIFERIVRCLITEHDPITGAHNAPVLKTLKHDFGATDFGVYGRVSQAK